MIKLNVKDYCQNCDEFEAKVTKSQFFANCETLVECEHAERCENIYEEMRSKEGDK